MTRNAGAFARIVKNAGWLLGGQSLAAVLSIAYLAMVTRTLGLNGFGVFSLILGIAQTTATIATFQSWQILIHYGVDHVRDGRRDRLDRLIWFCVGLDAASALIGSALSIVAVGLLAKGYGWNGTTSATAIAFCMASMLSFRSTPIGLLRLNDRYAAAATADAAAPIVKMMGAGVVVWQGWGLIGFLSVWALADVAVSAAYWIMAATTCDAPWTRSRPRIGGVRTDNEGLLRYAMTTNATSSLKIGSRSLAILVIGMIAGTVAAGAYRLCLQLSTAISKASQMISRSMFPEIARSRAEGCGELSTMLGRVIRMSLAIAFVAMLILPTAGPYALQAIGGHEYRTWTGLLAIIGGAAVVDMAATAFEPALFALGRQTVAFRISCITTVVMITAMIPATHLWGAHGAGVTVLLASIATAVAMGMQVRLALSENDAARLRACNDDEPPEGLAAAA